MGKDAFAIELNRQRYDADDRVEGTVRVLEDVGRNEGLLIALNYYDASTNLHEPHTHGIVDGGDGALSAGAEIPFSLTLPTSALPTYESQKCRLGWEVLVRSTVKRGRDLRVLKRFEVTPTSEPREPQPTDALKAGEWWFLRDVPGPVEGPVTWEAPGGLGSKLSPAARAAGKWDVTPTIASGVARRGGKLRIELEIGTSAADRTIEAGAICNEHYQYEDMDDETTNLRRRSQKAHESWKPIDAGAPSVEIEIPADAPFSYAGHVVYYEWNAGVRERTKGFDPERLVPIWVFP